MTISPIATGTAGANIQTIALAWSALTAVPASGDVAYLIWTCGSAQTVTTDPSGWTLQGTLNSSSGAMRTRVYSRVCTGTESGSISATASAINKQTLSVVVYRGVSNAAPVNAITSRNETVATTSHVCPDVTPTVAGCAIVTMIGERSSTGSTAFTTSGTYTVRVHSGTSAGGSGGTIGGIADDGLATPHTAGVAVTPANLVGNASVQGVTTWSLAIPPAAQSAAAATAGETDTARTLGRRKTKAAATAISTETARPIGRRKTRTAGTASATDTARPIGRRKSRVVATAQATASAQPIGSLKTRTVRAAGTAEAAQPTGRRKSLTLAQALAVETAATITRSKRRDISVAAQTDAARPASHNKTRTVGAASEADQAQPITSPGQTSEPAAPATEADTAQPIGKAKRRTPGTAGVVETARTIGARKALPVGVAAETATALPLNKTKRAGLGPAVEVDAASQAGRSKRQTIGTAAEADQALAFGGATETGPPARGNAILTGQAAATLIDSPGAEFAAYGSEVSLT